MQITPFTVHIPDQELADLKTRLSRVRWPDEVDRAQWDYGIPLSEMQTLIMHWRDTFDWRTQEAWIKSFPHYKAELDGFRVHFIHMRGTGANPLPVIITHGWPSSFIGAE
jgi:microsomal epoxide hydrolase